MTLHFSLQEQVDALKRIGYEIELVKEIATINTYYDMTEDKEVSVYRVSYNGVSMADEMGYGTKRVEYCFKRELEKRVLWLF